MSKASDAALAVVQSQIDRGYVTPEEIVAAIRAYAENVTTEMVSEAAYELGGAVDGIPETHRVAIKAAILKGLEE